MAHTNLYDSKFPKENMHQVCLAVIAIDSIMKMDRKYYPHISLEEC